LEEEDIVSIHRQLAPEAGRAHRVFGSHMFQHEAVIQTIERLGGVATLAQLNKEVFKIKNCEWKTKTPFHSIRRIVQTQEAIYKIKPGLYGLVSYQEPNEARGIIASDARTDSSQEVAQSDHAYYQGLLLIIGNVRELHTFAPNQDKRKAFLQQKIGDLRKLNAIPPFSYPDLVKRSSTVDVIWFNDRQMPHSFFEVESSTDIQNSLVKFTELQDFHARMYIVADAKRHKEFKDKVSRSAFKDIRERTSFLNYMSLVKQYESQMGMGKLEVII
jgi:hypothetical protein